MDYKNSYQIFNADCIDVIGKQPDNSVDLILTDLPYGEVNQKSGGLRKLDRQDADFCDIDMKILIHESIRVCRGSFYLFCGTRQISKIIEHFDDFGLTTRVGVWEKTNPSPMNGNRLWISGMEFCVFARKANATFNEHCQKAIWKFPSGRSKIHPTEKHVALMERLVKASSNENDVVMDLTMGSGTTGVAAGNLNRNFVGVEKSEEYFNIAKSRIEKAYSRIDIRSFT